MKLRYKAILVLLLAGMVGCVDDYTDANPPPKKDGPELYVTPPSPGSIVSTRSDGTAVAYVTKGMDASFVGAIVDAPGIIDSVSAYLSDTVGTVAVSGFESIVGSEEGQFSVVYTPRPNDPASTFDDNVVTLNVTVSDAQKKTTAPQANRVKAIACLPSQNIQGFWMASATGVSGVAFSDGSVAAGETYSIQKLVQLQIRTTGGNATVGTNAVVESAATLYITDAVFGLHQRQQGKTTPIPVGRFTFCGDQLTSYAALNAGSTAFATTAQGTPVYTGQINSDGTITLNYTNNFGDSGTVTLTRPPAF